jgi:hypothetical protein
MFLLTCRPYTGFWSYFYLEVMVWGVRRAEPKSRSDALQSIYPPCTAKQESCVWKWMMNLVNAYRPVFSWPSTLNPKPGPSSYNIDFIQKQKISLCSCNPCKIQGIISLIRFFFFFQKNLTVIIGFMSWHAFTYLQYLPWRLFISQFSALVSFRQMFNNISTKRSRSEGQSDISQWIWTPTKWMFCGIFAAELKWIWTA